jgi:hypothetical protein
MTHAYTGTSCSIAARPGHGLNSLTLTTATRAAGARPNVIRPVDARATGLFLTTRRAPAISHLLFVDVSLLFFRAVGNEAERVQEVLNTFERCTGQK